MRDFEEKHAAWLQHHLSRRTGERRGRLERGHQHAEILFLKNVWYKAYGHFHFLHPEYEVTDWRGRSYFADFAYLRGLIRLIIEIKGYQTHVKEMDRLKYCNELNRETFLTGMGYTVVSFAYDDVEKRPDICITLLRLVMSRFQAGQMPVSRASLAEKEIIRFALGLPQKLRPVDIQRHFGVDHKTALLLLRKLCEKGWLLPLPKGKSGRVTGYELARGVAAYLD